MKANTFILLCLLFTAQIFSQIVSQQWAARYNGSGNQNDLCYALTLDQSGNVYVTGRSIGVSTGYDYATIKYSDMVGITPISNGIPYGFSLGQNYPNPFNPSTNVNFDLPVSSYVTVKVYNIEGKEVLTPLNEFVAAGSYNLTIDAGKISSGVYFYKLIAGSFSETKRMVLSSKLYVIQHKNEDYQGLPF
jgi:hypothetical protein